MDRIATRKELERWLLQKPPDWSQVIAARIALRVLPLAMALPRQSNTTSLPLAIFRATVIAWASRNYPAHNMAAAASAASAFASAAADAADAADAAASAAASAADAAADAAASAAAFAADAAASAADAAAFAAARAAIWESINGDCEWLATRSDPNGAARVLTRKRLWWEQWPEAVKQQWQSNMLALLTIDPNYSVWVNWYERRLRGERAAFAIPDDKGRKEDKAILRQISAATNADFWDHGAKYVNAQLAQWLEEAREQAAKNLDPPTPRNPEKPDFQIPPESGRRLYGFNQDGLLDRLPPNQQDQLRDSPNQRRSYQHIRDDLKELLGEGQKLGRILQELLERAIADFPEDFGNAEAEIIWRHIGKLRRAYRKHLAAPKPPEPDDHRLDPQVAIDLDGLLDGINNFVLGDQGLLRRQEDAVDPQLRGDRKEEAKAAEPLAQATIASEGVVTRAVKKDIAQGTADLEAALPSADSGDPSADAEVDSVNRERRNIFGGLLTGAKDTLKDARAGAAKEAGKQSLDFITKNSQTIIDYLRKAFSQETAEAIIKWIGSLF